MAENGQDKVIAFDTLFTTNHIQILKILLSYIEPSRQKTIAVLIKFLELQYTISFFQMHPASTLPKFPTENAFDASKLCDEILPLCSHSEQEQINNMKNMYHNVQNMQEMMQMVQMMTELFPEGDGPLGGDPSGLFSGLSGLSNMAESMDISQLFEMMKNQ